MSETLDSCARVAPAKYLGLQPVPGRKPLHIYILTEAVGARPKGSTIAKESLEFLGFKVPPMKREAK